MSKAAFMVIELSLIILIGWSKINTAQSDGVERVFGERNNCRFSENAQNDHVVEANAVYYLFLFLRVYGLSTLDPNLEKGELSDILQATLSILAVLFVLLMTKEFVVIEGANSLLTLNMVVYLFQDEHYFEENRVSTCLGGIFVKGRSQFRREDKIFLGTRFIEILKAARRRSTRFVDCH